VKTRSLLQWLAVGITLGKLAFTSMNNLWGRGEGHQKIRTRSDLEEEFLKNPLPDWALERFDRAVQAQQEGTKEGLQEAHRLYFSLDKVPLSGGRYVNLPEGSAVVAWNVHVMYLADGQEEVANGQII
jgi:hypothetical protein